MKPNHSHKKGIVKPGSIEVTAFDSVIPDTESLAKMEQIYPGSTKRWMDMADTVIQSNARNESKNADTLHISTIAGVLGAIFAVTLVCAVSFYAIHKGYATQGASIMVGCAASVIGAFFFRRKVPTKQSTSPPKS